MRKTGNIIMNRFMVIVKSQHTKRITAAAVAVLLAAAVVLSSIHGRTVQASENADTLMGIEKLRNKMAEGGEYTILEIVPDNLADHDASFNAAEIGYLFDGYEPVLSEYDSNTKSWRSWKDRLVEMDPAERASFMAEKAKALETYYADRGLTNYPVELPVDVGAYQDSETYVEGYEEVESGDKDMTGYFVPDPTYYNYGKYYVSFDYRGSIQEGEAYYRVAKADRIVSDDQIARLNQTDGAYIYKYDGTIFQSFGTWAKVKDNFTLPSTGGGENAGEGGNGDENGDSGSVDNNVENDDENVDNGDENSGTGDDVSDDDSNIVDDGNDNSSDADSSDETYDDGESGNAGDGNNSEAVNDTGDSTDFYAQGRWVKYVSPDEETPAAGKKETDQKETEQKDNEQKEGTGNDNDSTTGDSAGSGEDGNNNDTDSGEGGDNNDTDSGEGGGNNGGGLEETGGNNGSGSGENGGNNNGGSGETGGDNGGSADDNQGDGSGDDESDNNDDNTQDGTDETPDDGSEDPGDGSGEETGKGPGIKPGGGNTTIQAASTSDEVYYIVYFERIPDGESLEGETCYVVNESSIKPAIYGSFAGEPNHPMGQYDFIENTEIANAKTYTFPGKVIYCEPKGIFHSNEWFKQYVINMTKDNFDDFKVKVITMTAEDINEYYAENNKVPDFDFLYLNSGLRTYPVDIKAVDDTESNSGNAGPDGSVNVGEPNGSENEVEDGEAAEPDDSDSGSEDGTADETGSTPEASEDDNEEGSISEPEASENDGDTDGTESEDAVNSEDSGDADGSADNGEANSSTDTDTNKTDDTQPLAAQYMSAWRTYVAQDDQETPAVGAPSDNKTSDNESDTADNNETSTPNDSVASDTTDTTGNADDNDTTGNVDNDTTDDVDNNDTTGDVDSDDATGETTDPDDGETPGDSDNTDTPDSSVPVLGLNDNSSYSNNSVAVYTTAAGDLRTNVADLIYNRVYSLALPTLVDGAIMYSGVDENGDAIDKNDNTGNTDIFRLAAMLCQPSLDKDYTGVSKENLLDKIRDGNNEKGDKNFTTEQTYCRLGYGNDSIINDNFFKFTIYQYDNGKEKNEVEEGFQNVLDEIELENLYRKSDTSGAYKPLSTNISQAEALRHIINYQNRRNVETKESIKVLEIQPALTTLNDKHEPEPELTLEQIQKWAPGVEKVETTVMTTSEFIGKIDKINEEYDLVYFGTSKAHLNIKDWLSGKVNDSDNKDYIGSTVYNDSDMDGLIYSNVGDKRAVYLPMVGLLDSEYKQDKDGNRYDGRTYYYTFVRYSGNDITKEKKDALLSFLDGSYPIVVSDEFIEQPVTVFESDNYGGAHATLGVGTYKQEDLEAKHIYAKGYDDTYRGISSIQVKEGYQVTLYVNPDCTGESITLTSADDVKTLSNFTTPQTGLSWNERCRSLAVKKIEDAQPVTAVDGNHIDNSSYLYEFVNAALEKEYTNFFISGDIDETGSELFKFYLNRAKASLVGFTANGYKASEVNDVYYINPNAVGRYTLQYDFSIKNEGAASMDTRYNCKLYIDVNADGKFSEYEEVSDIVMTNSSGGIISPNELYAGNRYTITREVPTGYKGLLPWKVEVCQVNNDNIYASQQGYTKLKGQDKEVIKICQITKGGNDVISLDKEINGSEMTYFKTLVVGGVGPDGKTYDGIIDDFELDITTIDINEYHTAYAENNNYLNDFNMLILGFSDMYGDFEGDTETGPMGAIVDFINAGKSVLMAHDTTSFFNNPLVDGTADDYNSQLGWTQRDSTNADSDLKGFRYDTRFAATLNKYIRPLVGMDRYGVLSSDVVKKGITLKKGNDGWNTLVDSTKEVAYKPKSGRLESVPEAQGYTYATITAKDKKGWDDGKTLDNIEFSKSNMYASYTPGYDELPDIFYNRYLSQRFDRVYYNDSNRTDYGEMDDGNWNNAEVNNVHVTQVNQGQITEYPYKLEDEFEVALTHTQYYQLDYTADDDGDGQSDLVVWYCLGGRTSSDPNKTETIYSQSPNDVRNNYYIYNKGNITYTGMGHASRDSGIEWYTFDEAKLFINTMIAAYQAGVKPPTVTVLESGRADAAQLTTMYRYYDEQNSFSLTDLASTDNYEKVYFTVRDVNFVKGFKEIDVNVYYHIGGQGGTELIPVDGEEIPVNALPNLIYPVVDGELGECNYGFNLSSGAIYCLLVEKNIISQCENGLDIYFEAKSTIRTTTTTENVYETDKVYAKLQVQQAFLFNLD